MKKKHTIRAAGQCLIGLIIALSAEIGCAQEARSWHSADGRETLEASLVDYEPKRKLVKLQTADGDFVELRINQLSTGDRRYVRNFRKQKRDQTANSSSNSTDATNLPENSATKEPREKRNWRSNSENLYGIEWTTEMEAALKTAEGREGISDDRPVMWFRVLGDLQGLM